MEAFCRTHFGKALSCIFQCIDLSPSQFRYVLGILYWKVDLDWIVPVLIWFILKLIHIAISSILRSTSNRTICLWSHTLDVHLIWCRNIWYSIFIVPIPILWLNSISMRTLLSLLEGCSTLLQVCNSKILFKHFYLCLQLLSQSVIISLQINVSDIPFLSSLLCLYCLLLSLLL